MDRKQEYIYIGWFVDFQELHGVIDSIRINPLDCDIEFPHITAKFSPEEVEISAFGKRIDVIANGYGNDGENEGILVSIETEDKKMKELFDNIQTPHITIAVSESGRPVNTKNLVFSEIAPIRFTATFGGYNDKGEVVY